MILLYEFDKPDIFSLPCENIWQDITFVIFNMIYKQWVPKRPQLVLNTHLTRVSYHTKQYQPMLCTIIYNTELHVATLYPPCYTLPHYTLTYQSIPNKTISLTIIYYSKSLHTALYHTRLPSVANIMSYKPCITIAERTNSNCSMHHKKHAKTHQITNYGPNPHTSPRPHPT